MHCIGERIWEEIRLKKWEYKIKNNLGIHARSAAMLVREAKKYESRILLSMEGQTAPAVDLMEIMDLDVKCGQTIEVLFSGRDEETAYKGIREFFEGNL